MDLAAREPDLVRGLVLSGATAEPVGLRSLPVSRPRRGSWTGSTGGRLDALNAWFFRTRYPPAIAEPIVAGGLLVGGRWRRRAAGPRRRAFVPRLAAYPGPTLILNGELDVLFRLSAPARSRGPPGDARRVRLGGATHLANLDRPARVQRWPSGASPRIARDDDRPGRAATGPVLDLARPTRPRHA